MSADLAKLDLSTLDSPDVDPVSHLNSIFPSEDSLAPEAIKDYLSQLQTAISSLNSQISKEVQSQSNDRHATKATVQQTVASVASLQAAILKIQKKAAESEQMVQGLCRDIRSLDTAKKFVCSWFYQSTHSFTNLSSSHEQTSDRGNEGAPKFAHVINCGSAVASIITTADQSPSWPP